MPNAAAKAFVVALTLAAVQTAAPALAKVTKTSTTTSVQHQLVDVSASAAPLARRFSGTSDGTPNDRLDLAAVLETGSVRVIARDISIGKNGTWSWQGPINALVTDPSGHSAPHRALKVAAVPAGHSSEVTGTAWRGQAITSSTWAKTSAGSPAWVNDYSFGQLGTSGWNDYEGFDSCGLCDGGHANLAGVPGPALWIWNASVDGPYQDRTSGGKPVQLPSISVDGVAAYASFFGAVMSPRSSYVPKVAFSASVDNLTGQATIREHHQLARCAVFPVLLPTDCATLIDTGVVLDRKIVQSADGLTVSITDVILSSNLRSHSWEVHYINAIRQGPGAVAWRLPGTLTWLPATPPNDQAASVSDWSVSPKPTDATAVTIGARSSNRSAASLTNPQGTITISPRPVRLWFPSAGSDRATVDMAGRISSKATSTNSFVYRLTSP